MKNRFDLEKNVLGTALEACCFDPITGFYRDGFCKTGTDDIGTHVVCAIMTEEFLLYSQQRGNDLITPMPEYQFPGLSAGDRWCLCASRWLEAERHGVAPPVILEAVNQTALNLVPLELLKQYAVLRE